MGRRFNFPLICLYLHMLISQGALLMKSKVKVLAMTVRLRDKCHSWCVVSRDRAGTMSSAPQQCGEGAPGLNNVTLSGPRTFCCRDYMSSSICSRVALCSFLYGCV